MLGMRLAGLGSPLPAPPGCRRQQHGATAGVLRCRQVRPHVRARDSKLTSNGAEKPSHGGSSGSSGSSGGGGGGGSGSGGSGGGGSGSGKGGDDEDHHTRRALLVGMLKWTAAAAVAVAALAAALPSALSQPGVLRAVLALVNSWVLPEAVSLQLDSLEMGWSRPVQLRGLRLIERSGASARRDGDLDAGEGAPFDPSSSDEEEDDPPPQLPAGGAGPAGNGSADSAGQRRGRRGEPEPEPERPAADGGSGKRRRTLVSVERISTPQTLWQLARGSPVEVVVGRPQVDCTFDATGKPRLLAVLQAAGQVPEPHPLPPPAVQAQVAPTAAPSTVALAAPQPPAVAAAGSTGGGEQQKPREQGAAASGLTAAAAAAAGKQRVEEVARSLLQDDSSDSDEEEPLPTLAQAAAAAVKQQQRGSQPTVTSVSPAALLGYMRPAAAKPQQAQQAQQQAQQQARQQGTDDEEGGSAAAGSGDASPGLSSGTGAQSKRARGSGSGGGASTSSTSKTWLPESLQHASAAVAITGEVSAGKIKLCVSDGALLVPAEARELLGSHLHFEVLQGTAAIEQAAADEEAAAPSGGAAAGAGGDGRKKVKWARQRPAVLLPWGTGMPQTPVAVRLDGQLMQFRLEGWQTARGFVYLVRPIEASMQFTPALSKLVLSMLHPALGGAAGMRGATKVQARLIPHNGLLPAKQATLRVEPLTVEIAESPVLRQTVGVLAEAVSKLKFGGSVRAELSPIQATLDADGRLQAERLDMRLKTGLGPWRQELHLVSWGAASLQPPQSLDATLCVPGDALKGLGLPEFPDGAGLGLHIGGSPSQPRVEIARASRDLALLLASQQASSLVRSKGGPQWLADKLEGLGAGAQARGVQMPPPLA
ncbi:hypothetical protein ABPG77_009586 [Micractinium sp. CCAP 211/92]